MESHKIWRLRRQHRELQHALNRELNRPLPDERIVQDLKRRKLAVKDALWRAESGLVLAHVSRA